MPYLVIKTFQKDETTPGSFMICYVELSQNPPSEDSFDCILPRLPSPRRAFHIRHSITGDSSEQQLPATIRRVGISGSGSHAATLSKVGKKLLIDLWELRLSEAISRVSYPYSHTISSAHAIIDAETVLYQDVGLSLSWDGSLIVAFKTRQTSPGKIHVFEYYGDVYRPQSKGQQVSLPLEPSNCHKKCTLLQSFRGDAKFTNLSISKWDYHSQRFIACDREGFSVYKTTDQWEMLYHVPVFHMYSDRAISTAVGGIFTLEISIYQLSIWDLVTGAPKHLIDTKHRIVGHFLSVTGETLAIAAEEAIFLYSTESGDLLQQFSESCDWWYGFVDGDRGIYGSHPTRQRHAFFITDIRNPSRPKRLVDASLDWNRIVRDVKVGEESDGTNIMLTAVLSFRESILEVNFLEDTLEGTVDEPLCTSACASDRITTPAIAFGEEVSYSGGAFVVQEATYVSQKQLIMDIRFKDGKSKRFWWVANSCFFIKESSRFMTSLSNRSCTRFMTWKLPQSSQDELELIFFGRRDTSEDVIELSTCSHGGYPVLSTVGRDLWLYSREWLSLDDPNVLSEELWMITGGGTFQCNEAMEAEARYLCSFDNHYSTPGNHSKSLVPRVCRIHAGFNNNRARPILKTLLQANNWIPLKAYSRGSNPLGIILEEARTESTAIEVARMLIDYSLNKVKEDNDLVYILYLLECMDELAARYPDLALRITRGFCYIRCYDRKFIINNHRIARPPSLWQIWSSDASKVYECRNPILQLDIANQNFDQLNEGFTEDVFVAPVNLLWSFIPKSHSPCSEFPLGDPNQRTTWIQTLYNIIVLNMNPFSHVYIRPRPFSLEILDNPAVEAVIQYKW
ncbi:hypothetical protein BGW38_008563 [Lunasporangiospora selenospora]|uniref:Uncharacterized protein n=1 Tax=Lunasporangiospora selenospora TaxID=979761 RepID=A0A9P6KG94_9FUNG|nr:hypothetical protein BGW38_008563 [Lunasporangiospora selenospora]